MILDPIFLSKRQLAVCSRKRARPGFTASCRKTFIRRSAGSFTDRRELSDCERSMDVKCDCWWFWWSQHPNFFCWKLWRQGPGWHGVDKAVAWRNATCFLGALDVLGIFGLPARLYYYDIRSWLQGTRPSVDDSGHLEREPDPTRWRWLSHTSKSWRSKRRLGSSLQLGCDLHACQMPKINIKLTAENPSWESKLWQLQLCNSATLQLSGQMGVSLVCHLGPGHSELRTGSIWDVTFTACSSAKDLAFHCLPLALVDPGFAKVRTPMSSHQHDLSLFIIAYWSLILIDDHELSDWIIKIINHLYCLTIIELSR